MVQQNLAVNLDDAIYQAASTRAQREGKSLDQVMTELLTNYSKTGTGITTYTVQRGDTLSTIARAVYGDPHKYPIIQQANNLANPGNIWVGQVLVIPSGAATTPSTSPAASPSPAQPTSPTPTPSAPSSSPSPVSSPAQSTPSASTPAPSAPSSSPSPVSSPAQPTSPTTSSSPASSPPSPAKSTPTLADYARSMAKGFRPDRAGNLRAVYQFQIGEGGGVWTVSITNQTCTVSEGQTMTPAATVKLNGADFMRLALGQLNTVQAYQQGRVKVQGDVSLAAKISDLFGPWAGQVEGAPTSPSQPQPSVQPTPQPAPQPAPTAQVYPVLTNGSFDDYQPYIRDGDNKFWKEPQFPEEYGKDWTLQVISERKPRLHLMNSGVYGKFAQKYFGGKGLDYHQHGRYSQVVASQYGYDLVFYQTITAQPGRDYTFKGMIVSFYKGTSGERADNKIFKTIGLDPTGGRVYRSASIVWGERDGKDNEWRYPSLRVKAQANTITVFIRLENTEKDVGNTELNLVHLDRFELES